MEGTADASHNGRAYALYPLRLGLAFVFVRAGLDKFTGWAEWVQVVDDLGFPLVTVTAFLVAFAELFGGLGILLGVLSRFSGVVLSVVMLVAIWTVTFDGFTGTGWFYDMILMAGLLTVAINGPGRPTLGSAMGSPGLDPETWLWERLRGQGGSDPQEGAGSTTQ